MFEVICVWAFIEGKIITYVYGCLNLSTCTLLFIFKAAFYMITTLVVFCAIAMVGHNW